MDNAYEEGHCKPPLQPPNLSPITPLKPPTYAMIQPFSWVQNLWLADWLFEKVRSAWKKFEINSAKNSNSGFIVIYHGRMYKIALNKSKSIKKECDFKVAISNKLSKYCKQFEASNRAGKNNKQFCSYNFY